MEFARVPSINHPTRRETATAARTSAITPAVTPFRFEHLYRAPDPAAIFASYFAADHVAEQDRRAEVRREIVEHVETPTDVRRVCVVYPRRQLPAVIRPLVGPDLTFDETVVWTRKTDRVTYDIRPRILGGRAQIQARYSLVQAGVGQVRRVYEGEVTVEVRLIGGRIERHIVEDLGKSLVLTAACTQDYLDRIAQDPPS